MTDVNRFLAGGLFGLSDGKKMLFLPYKGKKLLKGSVRESKTLIDILLGSQMKDVGCQRVLENAVIYLFREVFPF